MDSSTGGPPSTAADPPAIFVDRAAASGLDFVHFNGMSGELYYSEMMGSGVALFDADNDGDLDVYLVQGSLLNPEKQLADATFPPAPGMLPLRDRLYRNDLEIGAGGKPRLRFTDVTEASGLRATGYGMGVATGDFDNDGWTDLYVTNAGPNQLWRNNGPGADGAVTFSDVTAGSGADDPGWSLSAAWIDADGDGWLDLYVVDYVDFAVDGHQPCRMLSGIPDQAASFGLADLDRGRGDLEAAAARYQAILAAQPDALQIHYPLAQTLLRLGKKEQAQDHLRRSADFDPRAASGRATCPDPLDDELQLLMTGAPVHLERGRLAAAAGDAAGELEEYRNAVELAPEMPMALQSLGRALAQRGELQEGIELYRRAVGLQPGNADLRHDLGLLSLGLGRSEEAAEQFRMALEIDPEHPGALLRTAMDHQRRGRAADALALYDRVLATEPAHQAARIQRAMCLMQLGRRREAAAALGEILDVEPPTDPASRLRLAMAVGALGDDDRALRHLGAVLDLDADVRTRVQAHTAIAALLDRHGDTAGAAEHRAAVRTLAAAAPQ